jgi:hypothetical protein
MTQTIQHKPHGLPNAKNFKNDKNAQIEKMLRDIAFVLKMTQKVRESMAADEKIEELAYA